MARPAPPPSRRLLVWGFRLVWLSLPFLAGPALGAALDDASGPVRAVAATGLWLGWAVVLGASLVTSTASLTIVRIGAPAAVAAAVAAALAGHVAPGGLAVSTIAAVLALAAPLGAAFVQGSAYGDETRLPLRPPGILLLGPVELAWAVAVAGLATGPLLLAARQWVLGAATLAVGLPLAAVCVRALHQLARRWLVFVPAGLVVHDPVGLVDSVLVRRVDLASLGPALAGTDALDLTQRALGLALEIRLRPGAAVPVLARRGRGQAPASPTALLVAPTRPGRAVAEARRRRIPVG
ncbi:MAG: hypothetical protein IPM45_06550 [Acidimicrobiales bacterium]|nr:hypothetical protein [Acidimicrobiales bacterium]